MEFIVTFCIILALLFLLFCAGVLAVYLFRGVVPVAIFLVIYIAIVALIANVW